MTLFEAKEVVEKSMRFNFPRRPYLEVYCMEHFSEYFLNATSYEIQICTHLHELIWPDIKADIDDDISLYMRLQLISDVCAEILGETVASYGEKLIKEVEDLGNNDDYFFRGRLGGLL